MKLKKAAKKRKIVSKKPLPMPIFPSSTGPETAPIMRLNGSTARFGAGLWSFRNKYQVRQSDQGWTSITLILADALSRTQYPNFIKSLQENNMAFAHLVHFWFIIITETQYLANPNYTARQSKEDNL